MKRLCLMGMMVCAGLAQGPPPARTPGRLDAPPQESPNEMKPRREDIVKDDYRRNLEDAATLVRLAEELKSELEAGDQHVVSVKTMKKAKTIEKLASNIHARLNRY
jgi:hypothetical protein